MRRCADDLQALEPLCSYITRPSLANARVQCNSAGQVVLKLKTPWRDGTTHLVISPPEFIQRHIEWQLCGSQIQWFYFSSGSFAAGHGRQLSGGSSWVSAFRR